MKRPCAVRVAKAARAYAAAILYVAATTGCDRVERAVRVPGADAVARVATVTGAGATFPYPLYARWSADYLGTTGIRVNYYSVGSAEGARRLALDSVDFAATESIESGDARGATSRTIAVPTVAGAIAVTYNLPTLTAPLRLTGELLADIFAGRVTRWNDGRVSAHNPGVALPALPIAVTYREDSSGTTLAFTRYLATQSAEWSRSPGAGLQVPWPAGSGSRGNEGVVSQVKQTEGAIGVVELTYARQSRLPVAAVRNAAGRFVVPAVGSVRAALDTVAALRPRGRDFPASLLNAPGDSSYPIVTFTWVLLRAPATDAERGRAVREFLAWGLRSGDEAALVLGYVPLPDALARRAEERLGAAVTTPAP